MDERSLIIDISTQLEGFKEVNNKYNFRCPLCGDSQKSKFKKRGWLIERDGTWLFHCFNCSSSMSLKNFVKVNFPSSYSKYIYESLKGGDMGDFKDFKKIETATSKISDTVKSVLQPITDSGEALEYLKKRGIPENKIDLFYYVDDFRDITTKIDKFKDSKIISEPRIILPIYDHNGDVVAIIGRGLYESSLRYINLKFIPDSVVFGLYNNKGNFNIDMNRKVYVVEGAIDSLFINNAIAVNTSDLLIAKRVLGDVCPATLNYVFVPDNDRRNDEIINVYEKIIKNGEKIIIYPDNIKEKDINDIYNSGVDIKELLDNNEYDGLRAKVEFNRWKRA